MAEKVKAVINAVWSCVDYDAEGRPWLDNLKATKKLEALLTASDAPRVTQRGVVTMGELEKLYDEGFAQGIEKAAQFVKKWNFMACSDADGLVEGIRALLASAASTPPPNANDNPLVSEPSVAEEELVEKATQEIVDFVLDNWNEGISAEPIRRVVAQVRDAALEEAAKMADSVDDVLAATIRGKVQPAALAQVQPPAKKEE